MASAFIERRSEARVALDEQYEKLKTALLKCLEDRHQELRDLIDTSEQEDLQSLTDIQKQLQNDINRVNLLLERGMLSFMRYFYY